MEHGCARRTKRRSLRHCWQNRARSRAGGTSVLGGSCALRVGATSRVQLVRLEERTSMWYPIGFVLLITWLIGLVSGYTISASIHALWLSAIGLCLTGFI